MKRVTLVVPAPLSLSGQVQLPTAANSLPGHIRIPRSAYVPGRDVFLMIYGRGECIVETSWTNFNERTERYTAQALLLSYPVMIPNEVVLDGNGKLANSVLYYRIEPQDDAVIHGLAIEMEEP